MLKFIKFYEFMCYLFDCGKKAKQAGEIVKALLEAQSPRISNISENMEGFSTPMWIMTKLDRKRDWISIKNKRN
jgi:hypothetical protein